MLSVDDVLLFCSRFDRTARGLRNRDRGKADFAIDDEYDVQDLAYALLKPLVEDLKVEDPTGKLADTSGRLDLVSKRLGLVIEVKATLKASRDPKLIVRECMERIKLYSAVPFLRVLAFFIYDPEERIDDPDNVQRELEGPHTLEGREFMVRVVGPRFTRSVAAVAERDAAVPALELRIIEARLVREWGGVLVGVESGGSGPCPSAPKLRLRIGDEIHDLAVPPSTWNEDIRSRFCTPSNANLAERGERLLYFGPSDSQMGGASIALRPTGVLEIEVNGAAPLMFPFEIRTPRRSVVDDQDALNELSTWFAKLADKRAFINFADVDEQLGLPTGTASRHLANAVQENFLVERRGDETIKFKARPIVLPVSDWDRRGF